MSNRRGTAMVWGNCQAAPLADLLAPALAAQGVDVVPVPPVYQVSASELDGIRRTVARCELLVSHPIGDTYRVPGCATEQLAALLPSGARLVTVPVLYQTGAFPFMTHGYDGDGARIDAPVTDYHDLRMVRAAARGDDAATTVRHWPDASPADVDAAATRSLAQLRRREVACDVAVSDLLAGGHRWWTMTHPHNDALAEVARRVLVAAGVEPRVSAPAREYLGERRAPVDDAVYQAAAAPPDARRRGWQVGGEQVPAEQLARTQLAFYRARPDVVTATLDRQ